MRLSIIILFITSISFSSCKKDNRINFQERLEVDVELGNGLNLVETHVFIVRDIASLIEGNLMNNGITIDDVDEIQSGRGDFTFPFFNGDFDFIQRVSIRVFNRSDPDGFKEMYYNDFVPINQGNKLNLFSNISNLKNIVSNEMFDMEVRLKFRSFVPPQTRIRLNFGYIAYLK